MTNATPEDKVRLLILISGSAFVERIKDAKDAPTAIPKYLPVFAILEAIAALSFCSPRIISILLGLWKKE